MHRSAVTSSIVRPASVALAGLLLVAGCNAEAEPGGAERGGASPSPPPAAASAPPILQPGAPGEPVVTIAPEQVPPPERHNHTDLAFLQMMIPHHAQALVMSRLAPDHARSPQVKALASRIQAAQGPEIVGMAAWLREKGVDVPKAAEDPSAYDHGAHGHQPMVGMLTEQQMAELRTARGRAFDQLFLRSMIRHHRGAIEMADSVMREGADARVIEMANDVVASQSVEIALMQRLLKRP